MRRSIALLFVPALLFCSTSSVTAQPDNCVAACPVPCVKPITFPDRWDDVTGVPGYMGESASRRAPDWRNNLVWDREDFTDWNGNGLYDVGEAFVDGNANGRHDAEAYHPLHTGYEARVDVGLQLVLHPDFSTGSPQLGQYFAAAPISAADGRRNRGADAYRAVWLECETSLIGLTGPIVPLGGAFVGPTHAAMSELIAQDPDAYWDSATNSVQGSSFAWSPRIFLLPLFDPRAPIANSSDHVAVVKVMAFFAERLVGPAEVEGRWTVIPVPKVGSSAAVIGGSPTPGPVHAPAASWGGVKASYR